MVCVTKHPGQDHPFDSGGWWTLKVGLQRVYVLRGQEEQEEEGQVRGGVADELDEGLTDEQAITTLWRDQVEDGQQWEEEADEDAREEFHSPVAPSPARELVIPTRRQQLLTVGLSNKLREQGWKKATLRKLQIHSEN